MEEKKSLMEGNRACMSLSERRLRGGGGGDTNAAEMVAVALHARSCDQFLMLILSFCTMCNVISKEKKNDFFSQMHLFN